MENKQLTKQDYESILNILIMKKQVMESCAKDYEVQIAQVKKILEGFEPTVTVKEKSEESKKA